MSIFTPLQEPIQTSIKTSSTFRGASSGPSSPGILLEDGSYLLLEDGSYLLQE